MSTCRYCYEPRRWLGHFVGDTVSPVPFCVNHAQLLGHLFHRVEPAPPVPERKPLPGDFTMTIASQAWATTIGDEPEKAYRPNTLGPQLLTDDEIITDITSQAASAARDAAQKAEHAAWRASVADRSDEELVEVLSQGGHDLADPDDTAAAATELLKRLKHFRELEADGRDPE